MVHLGKIDKLIWNRNNTFRSGSGSKVFRFSSIVFLFPNAFEQQVYVRPYDEILDFIHLLIQTLSPILCECSGVSCAIEWCGKVCAAKESYFLTKQPVCVRSMEYRFEGEYRTASIPCGERKKLIVLFPQIRCSILNLLVWMIKYFTFWKKFLSLSLSHVLFTFICVNRPHNF